MIRRTYSLRHEPAGDLYGHVVRLATLEASRAYLITRGRSVSPAAEQVLQSLRPQQIERRTVTEWPGTELLGDQVATQWTYGCSRALAHSLTALADRVYDWLEPERPEDLGFLREDGSIWLASISHEREAFMELSEQELSSLREREPRIRDLLET